MKTLRENVVKCQALLETLVEKILRRDEEGNFYDSFRGEENRAELSPAKNASRQCCDSFCIPLTEFPLLRAGKGSAEPARASVDRKRVSPSEKEINYGCARDG